MESGKKVVWIIGASSGIGEALCYEYSGKGYRVILSSRREDELTRVQSELSKSSESQVLKLDLNDTSASDKISSKAFDIFGRIDVVILNGGISQRSTIVETSLDIDRKIMEINFFGIVAIAKSLIPIFRNQGFGHYVVVSSLAGKFGFYLRSAYSASKHALHGYFETLRLEEEKNGILVTIICPTFIKTNISLNALDNSGNKTGEMDKAQQNGISPEKCARQIFTAQQKNKHEVVIGKKKISVLLKRFAPRILYQGLKKNRPM